MTHSRQQDEPFFIGWADQPAADRRFFMRMGLGFAASAATLGFGLAALQMAPGTGRWDPDAVRDWRGIVTAKPYPMLLTLDLDGQPRTVLLSCLGKCGVLPQIDALVGRAVLIRGSLIQRGKHSMIAVDEEAEWIRHDPETSVASSLTFETAQALGAFKGTGEVLDSKCWFGAMRPSSGKVHKACASLCIRGGIPPAFFTRSPQQTEQLMIMTDRGRPYGPDLLELVADPVNVVGQLFKMGDLLVLDAPLAGLQRLDRVS